LTKRPVNISGLIIKLGKYWASVNLPKILGPRRCRSPLKAQYKFVACYVLVQYRFLPSGVVTTCIAFLCVPSILQRTGRSLFIRSCSIYMRISLSSFLNFLKGSRPSILLGALVLCFTLVHNILLAENLLRASSQDWRRLSSIATGMGLRLRTGKRRFSSMILTRNTSTLSSKGLIWFWVRPKI